MMGRLPVRNHLPIKCQEFLKRKKMIIVQHKDTVCVQDTTRCDQCKCCKYYDERLYETE